MTDNSEALLIKALVATVLALLSVIVALVAAAVAMHRSRQWTTAIAHGGGTFAASFGLMLLGLNTLWPS
ncbi:hypothetical protein AB0H76_07855 [Nocardia sp. NPDC050712]|uniref:hypothetical protein n=1 Tax=Nocardia sp. NPDC050712 TaxID=3155518 RepID=UPI0033FD6E82